MPGRNRQDGHCSDEVLIRYLDLELPSAERERVTGHLGACWQCRASLAGLESAIHRVASLTKDDRFVAPERVAAARRKFLEAAAPAPRAVANVRTWRDRSWLAAAAAAVAVVAAGITLRPRKPERPAVVVSAAAVSAAAVAEQVRAAEAVAIPGGAAVVQTFRFEARELDPPRRRSEASIEVWSDAASQQFGVRWMDSRERLIAASLRSTRTSADGGPLGWTLTGRDLDWDGLGEVFTAELQNRNGPLLLVSEFLGFCRYAGVQPVLESVRPRLLVSATQRSGQREMRFWIEADPDTRQPLRQGIVLRDGRHAFEVVLEPKGRTTARRIDPARFVVHRPAAKAGVPELLPPPPPADRVVPALSAEETEVEVRYALHRARQSSDALEVEPAARGGLVTVKGTVASAAQRDELEAALAMAGVRGQVAWLVQVVPPDPGRLAAAPAGKERAISRALHTQVWELAQIAGRYDEGAVAGLNARSRRLLGAILREKFDAVDVEANRLRAALGEPAAGQTGVSSAGRDWQAQVFALYRHVAALDNLVETQSGKPLVVRLLDALQQTARNVQTGELRP
jgi:hypothetical protein